MGNRKELERIIKDAMAEMGNDGNVKTEESIKNKDKILTGKNHNSIEGQTESVELISISEDMLLEIFNVLGSNKSSKTELTSIAKDLEKQGCYLNAELIREAILVYENRKALSK